MNPNDFTITESDEENSVTVEYKGSSKTIILANQYSPEEMSISSVGDIKENESTLFNTISEQFDIQSKQIKLFPNIVSDVLKVDFGNIHPTKIRFTIFDLTGKVIKTIDFNDNNSKTSATMEINLNDLKSGNYYLFIESQEIKELRKFIKN